ncbi:MAG: hypothetical protein ACRDIY_10310 [Chloroflexota bacterium]
MPRKKLAGRDVAPSTTDPREAADVLFGSSALVDLLVLWGQEPGRRYYVNELIRATGRFPRSIQLALARLEAAGLVRGERVANARFYQFVGDHPFSSQLLAIAGKIPRPVDLLRHALRSASDVRVAFLRAEDAESTTIDLVVVGRGDRASVEAALSGSEEIGGREVRIEYFPEAEWRRQAKRERSYVRWLLEERRDYLIGDDGGLPS